MKELGTKELQTVISEIQSKVHDFCEKRGIRYSLSGGYCFK